MLDFFLIHKKHFLPLKSVLIEAPLRNNYIILYVTELVIFVYLFAL